MKTKAILRLPIAILVFVDFSSHTLLAQNAFWSIQGEFEGAQDKVKVFFNLNSPIRSADPFSGKTFGHSGGQNAMGELIEGGGFDPILTLYEQGFLEINPARLCSTAARSVQM